MFDGRGLFDDIVFKTAVNAILTRIYRGFITIFNRRATEFDTRAKNWQGPEGLDP